MDAALTDASVGHELVDPLAERGIEKPHCFVVYERVDEVAKDGKNGKPIFQTLYDAHT